MKRIKNTENINVNLVYRGKELSVKAKSEAIVSEKEAEFLRDTCGFLIIEEVVPNDVFLNEPQTSKEEAKRKEKEEAKRKAEEEKKLTNK
jgi:hypothetical protein